MDHSLKNKKILITCGPTWVPIDSVRVVSNISSGALGQQIALDCAQAGAKVTLLEGPVAVPLKSRSVKVFKFHFFDELQQFTSQLLYQKPDAVIYAAAVADYQLKKPLAGKLSSKAKSLKLELTATPKLIQTVKRQQPKTFLVGFKLEPAVSSSSAKKKINKLFSEAGCDIVVANQVSAQGYKGFILDKLNNSLGTAKSRKAMSKTLVRILSERL